VDGKGADGVGEEEKRKQEVRARIERLRENGWRRERFDGARYKALCERALGESD
jgi:DNA polymerase IIIc chi subunit